MKKSEYVREASRGQLRVVLVAGLILLAYLVFF